MKEFKKLFSDTAITTTLMLKKCVKVPKYTPRGEGNTEGPTAKQFKKLIEQ